MAFVFSKTAFLFPKTAFVFFKTAAVFSKTAFVFFKTAAVFSQTKVIFYKGKNITVDRDFFSGGSRSPPLKGRGRGGVSIFFHRE
jgi:hypothetical protein